MAIYLGNSEKMKINLDGVVYNLRILSQAPIANYIRLLSSEGYMLKDSQELYLTAKEVK